MLDNHSRGSFTGKLGFVLAAAGASVGLGNIWRFPYLAAKHGGGIFVLVYFILAVTFGYTMIISETAIGRRSGKSPVSAFRYFADDKASFLGGWINAVIPVLIVPYYSVIGGWVFKYLHAFIFTPIEEITSDTFFTSFISSGWSAEFWFVLFALLVLLVIAMGVKNGVERVSRMIMPVLVVLAVVICGYVLTLPSALKGVRYLLVPDLTNFTWRTVVAAMGQLFYSLSIAMGILITFGSYMKKSTAIETSAIQVEIFDTAIALMSGLIIIPAVFAFSGGADLQTGPSLMFVIMPKIFMKMQIGRIIGILFFVLVLFAALTSAIALTETVVSVFADEFRWNRLKGTAVTGVLMLLLGTLSCLGYGPLASVTILGMQFLDFFDFLTNSVMMPISALLICMLVNRHIGTDQIAEEVETGGAPFARRGIFRFMIRWVCPLFILIILLSSVASAFGWIRI
ncbi:MAG: sodium-dependent transporter [Solobacterium sp.]|nr:sodium-dependent transporter [Solobacterium sp.]